MRLATSLAALGVCVLLTACGGGGKPKASTGASGASGEQLTKGHALALAGALNLQPSDAIGFRAVPHSSRESAQEKALSRELETCAGASGQAHKLAEAKSDEFKRESRGLPQEVSSSVAVMQAPAYAQQDLRAIRSKRGRGCVGKLIDKAFKGRNLGGASIGASSVREGAPPSAGTDGAFGLRVTLPITAQGITLNAYVDFLGFAHGAAEVTLQSVGVEQPFPAATQERLFRTLVQRASTHPVP